MNTLGLIKEKALKVASESNLEFLLNDVTKIAEGNFNKNKVESLERAFINANYAGDYKAGLFSFLLSDYLDGYDIIEQLKKI